VWDLLSRDRRLEGAGGVTVEGSIVAIVMKGFLHRSKKGGAEAVTARIIDRKDGGGTRI